MRTIAVCAMAGISGAAMGQSDATTTAQKQAAAKQAAIGKAVPVEVALAATGVPQPVQTAAASIDAEKLRAHVRFLSHDLLEGRGTGQRGGDIAAEYVATQFALYGLKPAGDVDPKTGVRSYLQKVDFVGVRTNGEETKLGFEDGGKSVPLKFPEDYIVQNQTATPVIDVDAPIVFVGFGISAPEYKWDDYKGVDLHGKVALVIVNQPGEEMSSPFHGKSLTYYGRWTYKYEELARRGAVGVLIIHRTDLASYGWDVLRSSGLTERSELVGDTLNTLEAAGWVTYESAGKLFALSGRTEAEMFNAAQSRDFKPVDLGVTLRAHIVSEVRKFTSNNVIAQLPGGNVAAGKPDAAVIYTGHYDHLGLGANKTGDNIYNGAADNATGSAIVLELARAWSQCTMKPAHSVFFSTVTGEEQGLLGSRYLGMHPPIPAAQISLDLNYDELLPVGDMASVMVSGAERTSFWPVVEQTAEAMEIAIQGDEQPMAGHYYRSDHFSFARVGVPAFSVDAGTLYVGHNQAWGVEQKRVYDSEHYHQVSDEYRPSMDFSGNATLARFGFVLGWKATAMASPLGWQKGDEFEAARKKSEQ
jgi:Zn-dependent M28 family amino/carboxypeptidase